MPGEELLKAREYEELNEGLVSEEARPAFHLSPRIGWLNDPNGFSFYEGRYHLFYQYHPYDTFWGPMHWGHAVSDDLISWEYLPCALAPDEDYDGAGCFSGSAVTMPDGRQLLMYTGCEEFDTDEFGRWKQSQCIAVSSAPGSVDYVKYEGNPVISGADLPDDGDPYEFRDPYIWQAEDGTYRAVVANARRGAVRTDAYRPGIRGGTQLNLYASRDAFSWERSSVLFEDWDRIGIMWECPNYFVLDGKQILIASPMDMELEEADGSVRFPKGNNVCYITGEHDERTGAFIPDSDEDGTMTYLPVDLGLDFYAPQVLKGSDGRTVMIGWMQDPSTAMLHGEDGRRIFGQMSIPRELSLEGGRLIQSPVRELESYRSEPVTADVVLGPEPKRIEGVSGRVADIEIMLMPETVSATCDCSMEEFAVSFAADGSRRTELRFRPDSSVLTIDRSLSGQAEEITKKRSVRIRDRQGSLNLRILLDRYSAEIFVNGGEQVMSLTLYTPLSARDIIFSCEGRAVMYVKAYELGKHRY